MRYRVDYFSRKKNAYTYKVVEATSFEEAIKKSRVKDIEEIRVVDENSTLKKDEVKK